jgi:LacI family transcriptional regulator
MPPVSNRPLHGKGRIIAMLVDHISDPYFAEIARRIDMRAGAMGYKVVLSNTEGDPDLAGQLIEAFENMKVAAYIIASFTGVEPVIQPLIQKNRTVILLDAQNAVTGAYNIRCDDNAGAYEGVRHLVANDYHRIGLVTIQSGHRHMADRRKGYEAAVKDHGLDPCIAVLSPFASQEEIKHSIRGLLRRCTGMDALLFADNNLTFNGMIALRQLEISIPDDLAVVGIDDNDQFSLFSPAITVVAQPLDEMAENIVQYINAHPIGAGVRIPIVLSSRLILRQSSGQTMACS